MNPIKQLTQVTKDPNQKKIILTQVSLLTVQPATPARWRGSTLREQPELGTAQTSTDTQKTFTQLR